MTLCILWFWEGEARCGYVSSYGWGRVLGPQPAERSQRDWLNTLLLRRPFLMAVGDNQRNRRIIGPSNPEPFQFSSVPSVTFTFDRWHSHRHFVKCRPLPRGTWGSLRDRRLTLRGLWETAECFLLFPDELITLNIDPQVCLLCGEEFYDWCTDFRSSHTH